MLFTGKQAIKDLLVNCINVERGCEWTGAVDALQNHALRECEFSQSEEGVGEKCILCLKVAEDPLQHMACGELFCWKCLAKHQVCPYCGIKEAKSCPKKISKCKHAHTSSIK